MPRLDLRIFSLFFVAVIAGCPADIVTARDTGARDAGVQDAPARDASPPADAGPDAGDPDRGFFDSEPADRGPIDTGAGDAGFLDATPIDAGGCTLGSAQCSADGFGFEACGYNELLGLNDRGPRVACAPNDPCVNGACARSQCVQGEVLVVLDRSASMSFNSTWIWVRDTLLSAIGDHDRRSLFGLRQFPTNSCSAGTILRPASGAEPAIRGAIVDPGAEASSPIEAALTGLRSSFGPARDGLSVLLVTGGAETCGMDDLAVRQASMLFRAGIKTHVIAIHTSADRTLLDRIAQAGGTRRSRLATDLQTFTATLGATIDDMNLCDNPHAQVGAGFYHTCGLRTDGTLACWGRDLSNESSPPAGTYTHLGVGTGHSCAVSTNGSVSCWGRNDYGQTNAPSGSFIQVAAGDGHSCGLRIDNTADCWGHDDIGQASPPSGIFKQITCAAFSSCGIRMDDTIECWGMGVVRPSGTVQQIDGGSFKMCAILTDGTISCSQNNGVPPGTFKEVSAGDDHDCAIRTDGTIACWGQNNAWGQLNAPPGRYAHISVNYNTSCAVRESDDAWVCWGYDGDGQATPP